MGYGRERPTRLLLLTLRHRTDRPIPAHEIANWTLHNFQRVAWSFESRCQLFSAHDSAQVWFWTHESTDPSFQQNTAHAAVGSPVLFGMFTWYGLHLLVHLNTLLSRERYVALIRGHFHRFMSPSNFNPSRMIHRVIACPRCPRCPELFWGALWKFPTNGVTICIARHEPNQIFLGCGKEIDSHARCYA